MSVYKNDIPILEYDDSQTAVIMPNRHNEYAFPEYAVFPFLSNQVDEFAKENNCAKVGEFISATKIYPIYQLEFCGKQIVMCQAPVGAAPAVQILDYLIGYGVKNIISAGTCGALKEFDENVFLIPTEALRDEGTSYHYLPPSRTVLPDADAIKAIESALEENGIAYERCKTWSTDGFFRETKDIVEYRKSEGCSVVEMECSALCACAKFRGVRFGQILFTADTLANVDMHDDRDWGMKSFPIALKLSLEAVVKL